MQARARIRDFVPETYHAILPDFFDQPLAEERHATCGSCAMCPQEPELLSAGEYFNPSTKCCTYHPFLPNYAVGGLLADESPDGAEGRRRILNKISARIGVTPAGILPPAKQRLLYRHGKAGFGKANALACPYLDQDKGACTVWKQREAVCATWFCKHDRGEDGAKFWNQLRDYLIGAEFALCAHALLALDWDADHITTAFPQIIDLDAAGLDDAPPPPAAYAALWRDWQGREPELYVRSYEIVTALRRDSFETLAGVRNRVDLERLKKRYGSMLHPELPDPLLKNPRLVARRGVDGSYVLVSYSGTDPTRLRKPVFDLLDYFDGRRSTAEVRAAILVETGFSLSDSLITKLYQHRVVVDASVAG
jgi:hypothetical protein